MKCCNKCNLEKDDGDFSSGRNVCKICCREYKKKYRQNNKEAIKQYNKQYCQNNAEKVKEQMRQYRQNNKEFLKEKRIQYLQNNKHSLKEKSIQYRQKNKEVIKERQKQYYQNNKDSLKEKKIQYRRNNLEKTILRSAKNRAKKKNLPFNLREEDIVVPSICPILGIPLETGNGKGLQSNSPSLDRIIPEKGYVKGNIIVISNKANMMKYNATPEEMIKMGEFAKKLLEEANKNDRTAINNSTGN